MEAIVAAVEARMMAVGRLLPTASGVVRPSFGRLQPLSDGHSCGRCAQTISKSSMPGMMFGNASRPRHRCRRSNAAAIRFHFTDLVTDRADVGFRVGSPPSEGAIARRLLPIQLIVCAAPAYIEQHGKPKTIDDHDAHRCSGYRRANMGKQAPWEFLIGSEIVYREIAASLCANDIDAETEAVVAGLAIGQLGSFSAVSHIRAGRLVPLLTQYMTERESIYIYYRHRTEQPVRVRTFIDFMIARLADNREFFLTAP
ncbi:substrate binding domain-containing protein [Burkholderia sp. IMCC1007]|uniref:substrate binding domain-containing protein n=1 Tax=Burkholderia sp. IMCC1007 TaxID=3004104 RepID=UPI0022B3B2DE|nr:substrate binding domain-containing protein [Burkholderia sp. IMCC1007]